MRGPTSTEILVNKLIGLGLELERPREHAELYRVQPKVTGCESRRALCYRTRHGCQDISGNYENRSYEGIDLLGPVKLLAEKPIEIHFNPWSDSYLWVCLKPEQEG